MTTRRMTLSAMLTALLCLLGPVTLPLGSVPLSLTTAALMLMGLLVGSGQATLCCGLYLLIGLAGLPVFSGFTGGPGAFLGPTGGFLLGYLPATALWGFLARMQCKFRQCALCIAGTLLLYACGALWYMLSAGAPLTYALTLCALPFLPGDALKIVFLLTAGNAVRRRIRPLLR